MIETEEATENYSMEDVDLHALRSFRDKEQYLGRWSQEVPEMLPGMKVSPMFVVWRNEKPRIDVYTGCITVRVIAQFVLFVTYIILFL